MDRFLFSDIKKLKKVYLIRLFAVSVPFIQTILVLSVLLYLNLEFSNTLLLKRLIVIISSFTALLLILGITFITLKLKGHKKNTFIDFSNRFIAISIHSRTVIDNKKFRYYKSLYIIKPEDIKSIKLKNGKIIIDGTINYYYEPDDFLLYSTEKGNIKFDNWWYDYNPTETLSHISVKNYFKGTPRAVFIIRKIAELQSARKMKFNAYRTVMLQIADLSKKKRYSSIKK